ncbi:hypothetical protein WJX84_010048 [Apatococcus fuscideae]|uniref:Molecular chaperone DnaJ n=1 Tax=Apatococcus fuscideae TaxID=2026836 RepID=A0AAW1SUN5_9CHLO
MTPEEAREKLGVKEDANFEQVLRAKNKLRQQADGDTEQQLRIDSAYEVLLMQSMNARLSGNTKISSQVKFADDRKVPPAQVVNKFLQKIPGRPQVTGPPAQRDFAISSAIFGVLAGITLIQGLGPSSGPSDVPSLQLGVGSFVAGYFLVNQRRVKTGKAVALIASGILGGVLFGSLLNTWLQVDIVPIGGLSSSAIFVSEFVIVGLWAASSFLI